MAVARKSFPAGPSLIIHKRLQTPLARRPQAAEPAPNAKQDHGANDPLPRTNSASPEAKREASTFATLDLLLSVAQDVTATPAERRKAASEVARYFLPKNSVRKKSRRGKFPPDECGFAVDPNLARELRDTKLRLACLPLAKKLTPYALAQKATKLQARIGEIQQLLQCPCPSKYGLKKFKLDSDRLDILGRRRASRKMFTPEEDLEEAVRTARYDSFREGPEIDARRRLADLCEKKRVADLGYGPPLTHTQRATFRFLTLLFPLRRRPNLDATKLAKDWFQDLPVSDGEPGSSISQPSQTAVGADANHGSTNVSDPPAPHPEESLPSASWPESDYSTL